MLTSGRATSGGVMVESVYEHGVSLSNVPSMHEDMLGGCRQAWTVQFREIVFMRS